MPCEKKVRNSDWRISILIDISFDNAPWETELNALGVGETLSAAHFLTLMESEDELSMENALSILDEKEILLDISDLPKLSLSGPGALRLRQEAEARDIQGMLKGLPETDPLRIYLQELPAPSGDADPQKLAERFLNGEHHLAEALVTLCLPLVLELSMDYTGCGVLMLDLIGEGSLGLWQGILQYPGGDFMAFAERVIRRSLSKAVCLQARSSGVGQKLREDMADYIDADQRLLIELGRNPTPEEIAESLHLSPETGVALSKMVSAARQRQKVEASREEPELTIEDQQAVEDTAYFQMRQRIMELMSHLSSQDAKLLSLRFGLEGTKPLSPLETGEILGLTADEVLRREAQALSLLRNL